MKKTLIGIALFIGGILMMTGFPDGPDALGFICLALSVIGLIIMIVEFFIPEKKKEKKTDEAANEQN